MTKRSKVPVSSYLVCATQRSGSTFLCEALSRTGVAGRPDEYFEGLTETQLPKPPLQWFEGMPNRATITGLSDAWGPPHTEAMVALSASRSYSEYLEWVFEQGTTPNGVFGAKMMWSYLPDFAEQVRTIPEYRGLGVGALLESVFPSLRFVWVTRREKVKQAVSMWRAVQTDSWRAGERGDSDRATSGEPVFDFDAIDHLKRRMADDDAAWCAFFYRSGIRPLTIVYEDFEADYDGALRRILGHLGVPFDASTLPEPPTRKQADARSEDWIAEYRRLDAERAASSLGPRRPFPQRLTRADSLWWQPDPEPEQAAVAVGREPAVRRLFPSRTPTPARS